MISNEKIEALVDRATQEGVEGNIRGVLQNTLTVGDLQKILEQFDPATPVELEIPVEVQGAETLSEFAYLTGVYDNSDDAGQTQVLTLQGCIPELFEDLILGQETEKLN